MSNLRILVTGGVDGHFQSFFQKISNVISKSGPFEMLICVGDFFSTTNPELNQVWIDKNQRSSLTIPSITTYILGPACEDHVQYYKPHNESEEVDFEAGFEIAEDIIFLGKKGILTGASGFKLAYLSGIESDQSSKFTFSNQDINELTNQIEACSSVIDVLITYQPSKGFSNCLGTIPIEIKKISDDGSELISRLAFITKPRYHFTSSLEFLDRHPYRNHNVLQESSRQVTRFISLAKFNLSGKPKNLYAFQIIPSNQLQKKELIQQPDNTTECPYKELMKILDNEKEQSEDKSKYGRDQFFFNSDYKPEKRNQKKRHHHDQDKAVKKKKFNQASDNCWFCLASPQVEKHLIVSIGDFCYLALAKGELVDEHCLILPIGHHRSLLEVSENQALIDEIEKYKSSLNKYFASKNETPIYFERNFRSFHFQLQVVPVSSKVLNNLEEKINKICLLKNIEMKIIPPKMELKDMLSPNIPYFYLEIPSISLKMFTKINPSKGFSLQFGRELLADPSILNITSRIDWKKCSLDDETATQKSKKMRDNFKNFDFTLL